MEPTRLILLSVLLFAFASIEIAAQDEDGAFLTVVPKDEERHVQSRTVRLTCVAYGVPFPNVTWTRLPSTVLTSNIITNTTAVNGTTEGGLVTSTLTICNVQLTDSGQYRCETSNGATASPPPENSITVKNFTLVIIPIESPTLVLYSPDKVYAETNTTIRLVCSATGVPSPTVNWTVSALAPTSTVTTVYSNTTAMNGTEIVTTVLELCSVVISDTGTYVCTATNERGNESRSIDLTVTSSPVIDEPTSDQSVEVLRGDDKTLSCKGEGYRILTVTWLRNGVVLTQNSKYSIVGSSSGNIGSLAQFTTMITINSLVKVDEGNYTCRAQVEGSNMTAEINFRVTVLIPVTPTIILKPPSNVTLQPDQTVRLTCSATGVPTPNVTWFNSTDSQLMNDTNVRLFNKQEIINGTTIVTSVLQLCSIRIADAGVYSCKTGNDSTTVNVLVQVPIQVTNGGLQRNFEIQEFKNVTLECAVSGHPLPTVTWRRNDTLLSTDMKYLINNMPASYNSQTPGLMGVTSTLTIVNLVLEDTNTYICRAENDNSNKEVQYMLTVTSPARIIGNSSPNITMTAGTSVTMECTGAGVPLPTVEWSNSNGPVPNDNYHDVLQDPEVNHTALSRLRLPTLQISQEGTYRCSAGSTSVAFRITVQVRAELKSTTGGATVNGKLNESVTVTCTADGYPRPTITWFKDGVELIDIEKYFPSNEVSEGFRSTQFSGIQQVKSNLIIRDLQVADAGMYTCQAISAGTLATPLSNPYQLTVTLPPPPDPCETKNCNHGTCVRDGATARCVCDDSGYTGDNCDEPPTMPPVVIAPEIVTHPSSVTVRFFQGANLTCKAIGSPAPNINWFKNGEQVTAWNNRQQVTIDQVDLEDRGFYYCTASNDAGVKTSSKALLNINDIIQYKAVVNLPSSARRRRQSNDAMLNNVIDQINTVLRGAEFEGARFFSAARATDSSDIIMTFTSASISTQRLRELVNMALAANNVMVNTAGNTTVSITTTEFSRFDGCPMDTTVIPPHQSSNSSLNITIDWPESSLGENVTVDCPCGNLTLGSESLVAYRYCGGNFRTGGRWEQLMDSRCNASDISRTICELANKPPTERLNGLNEIFMMNDTSSMIMDYEVTASVSLLVNTTSEATGNQTLTVSYLQVVNNILQLEPVLLAQTQDTANTSSRLLEGVMNLAENLPIPENSTEPVVVVETHFAVSVQEFNPDTIPNEGLSFGADLGSDFNFGMPVGQINTSSLMFNRTATTPVTASVLLPFNALNITNNTRVAFSVFLTDALFLRRMQNGQGNGVSSVILSASVVGQTLRDINPRVRLVFQKNNNNNGTSPSCNFWNQTLDEGYGDWSDYGCERANFNMSDPDAGTDVTCLCNHLTSFAILLDVGYTPPTGPSPVDDAFQYISYIGVSISIVCLIITMVTYISIKKLRTKDQGQLLLLLCFALLGLYVSFILAGLKPIVENDVSCTIFSSLIQYFMLVTFMSMLAESVNLYMKLVVVLGSQISYYVIKAYIVVWLIPIFVVLLTLIPGIKDYQSDHFCIPQQIPFYIGTIVPVLVIYLFNCVLFVIIFASLIKKSRQSKNNSDESGGNKNYQLIKQQFIAALSLAVLFGLGWGFGFVATSHLRSVEVLFRTMQILFIVLTSFQGLFVFLFQCVYSKAVRDVWVGWFTRVVLKRTSRSSNYMSTSSRAKKNETLLSNHRGSNSTNSYVEMDIKCNHRGSTNSSNSMDSKEKSGTPEKSPDSFKETCN